MRKLVGIALLLGLGACNTADSAAEHYSSLEQFLLISRASHPDTRLSEQVNTMTATCQVRAAIQDIPEGDQLAMLRAINTRQLTPAADELFVKWFGRTMAHGAIQQSNSDDQPRFEDGTPVAGVQTRVVNVGTDAEFTESLDAQNRVTNSPRAAIRMAKNAKQICPDLVEQYPDLFPYSWHS